MEDALFNLMKGVTGLLPVDRLLVLGTISARSLEILMTDRRASLSVMLPERPYPCPEPADVAWVLAIRHRGQAERRIAQARRCLVPGGRLLLQLQGGATEDAAAIAAKLRQLGLVRVAAMPIGAESVLVSGQVSTRLRRAA